MDIEKELEKSVKIFGKTISVNVIYSKIKNPELDLVGNIINVYLPNKYKRTGNVAIVKLAIEKMYQEKKFKLLSKEEYIDIVVDQLELLREEIVIHRITGDPKLDELIEPTWLTKKFCVLNDIDKEMVRRDTYQGIKAHE